MAKKVSEKYTKKDYKRILSPSNNEKANERLFLPNSIFEEIMGAIDITQPKRSAKHLFYAYGYVVLTSYLWRYCKFNGDTEFNEEEYKKLLGVSAQDKFMNYITKKDGVLADLRYIRKVSDCPIYADFHEETLFGGIKEKGVLDFQMLSEVNAGLPEWYEKKNVKNQKYNMPLRGYYSCQEFEDDNYQEGYFWDIGNFNDDVENGTHEVDINTFIYCMSNEKLGLEAFWLYHFMKFKQAKFKNRMWNIPMNELEVQSGVKGTTLVAILNEMEALGMIDVEHRPYIKNLQSGKKVKANGYMPRKYDWFYHDGEKRNVYKGERLTEEEAIAKYGESIYVGSEENEDDFEVWLATCAKEEARVV